MSAAIAAAGPSAYWYLTRATGVVALLLATVAVALGVLDVRRFSTARTPRFLIDSLHRSSSLLAIVFLAVHVLTSVLDSFAKIAITDAFVPFAGSYRPFWLGLGALSLDLLLAVTITSLLRQRIGYRSWRVTHWLAYASWPVALLHALGTGSDVKQAWMLWLSAACVAVVLAAVLARVAFGWPQQRRLRVLALASAASFSLFLLAWLPGGPLGSNWARRSGTPSALLETNRAATHATRASGS